MKSEDAMYIPFWLLFVLVMWTLIAIDMCRDEAYVAGTERRAPNYRSCWGAASLVIGACVVVFGVLVFGAPLAVQFVAGLVDVARSSLG
jgi:ABC-type phosphate transport system permease subunit